VNVVELAERMPPGFRKRIEGVMVRVSLKDETESSSVAVTGTTAPGPETVLAPSATEHLTSPPHTVDGVRLTATLLPAESWGPSAGLAKRQCTEVSEHTTLSVPVVG
jgi:hypothetical protein